MTVNQHDNILRLLDSGLPLVDVARAANTDLAHVEWVDGLDVRIHREAKRSYLAAMAALAT